MLKGKGQETEGSGKIRYFPLLMMAVGLVIHLAGLIRIPVSSPALWEIWVHLSMLGLDGAALYGLIRGRNWGRILSLVIFTTFGLVQLYLGLAYLASGGKSPFGPQNGVSLVACAAAALCLLPSHGWALKEDE